MSAVKARAYDDDEDNGDEDCGGEYGSEPDDGNSYLSLKKHISQTSGLFSRDMTDGGFLLMRRDTLAYIMGGQCNQIFLKAKDALTVMDLQQRLTDAFSQYAVRL